MKGEIRRYRLLVLIRRLCLLVNSFGRQGEVFDALQKLIVKARKVRLWLLADRVEMTQYCSHLIGLGDVGTSNNTLRYRVGADRPSQRGGLKESRDNYVRYAQVIDVLQKEVVLRVRSNKRDGRSRYRCCCCWRREASVRWCKYRSISTRWTSRL